MSGRKNKTPWNVSARAVEKVKNPLPAPTHCPLCNTRNIQIKGHTFIYGKDYGDWPWVYFCMTCQAYVGMHAYTAIPLGTLADGATRKARAKNKELFICFYRKYGINRTTAYNRLAAKLGIYASECHFGWFDIDRCNKAGEAIKGFCTENEAKTEKTINRRKTGK